MCVRGASAIQAVLDENAKLPVRVLVVWEPVIATDVAPPTSAKLGLVHDPRAVQYWDKGRALSKDIMRAARENPSRYSMPAGIDRETTIWDVVAVFPKNVRWERDIPVPSYYGGPVVEEVSSLRKAVAEQLSKRVH